MHQTLFNTTHTTTLHRLFATLLLVVILTTTTPFFVRAQSDGDGTGANNTEESNEATEDETSEVHSEDDATPEDGTDGETGDEGVVGESGDTIPVSSENNISTAVDQSNGADGSSNVEDTGGTAANGSEDVTISTGNANASGEITTNANNTQTTSELGSTSPTDDLDTYTHNATGTNEAEVGNTGTTSAKTGENTASSTNGDATVASGNAVSVLNIANLINTNVINSTGFIHLLNQLMEAGQSLDLRNIFFPNGGDSNTATSTCSLMSCAAEDIIYNIEHMNQATVTNKALIEAVTGKNAASGKVATVITGDAYAAANLMNIINSNIIDSNYILLALNILGALEGDLILPAGDLFASFFAKPNGVSQLEEIEDAAVNDNNENNADVSNDLKTKAESGANQATTTATSTIKTGNSNADSNIVNEINKNLFGGDSMYMLIRIHGSWDGNLYGLPDGLTWVRTDAGVLIYNENAEIVPSQIVAYDVDSYTANFNNQNDVAIDNDMTIDATSGENSIEGEAGSVSTGKAYAGANVMNIANTNVIGRNWVMATMNIFGDLNGDISFGRPDLWIGGQVSSPDTPVGPGSKLTYTYTIKNKGDLKASNVVFEQDLESAHTFFSKNGEEVRDTTRREILGTIKPGQSIEVSYDAFVDENLSYGTTPVRARAHLSSDEPENNEEDNTETLSLVAERQQPSSSGGGSGGSGGGSSSGGASTGSSNGGDSRSAGRVLGAKMDRTQRDIDPDAEPKLSISKDSDQDNDAPIAAGTVVVYTITVTNDGGRAYNARVVDQLTNPIGSVVNEQAWDLGTIAAGEQIVLTYEIKYNPDTPTGAYENVAKLVAYETETGTSTPLEITPARHTLSIEGANLAVGNVRVVGIYPTGPHTSAAVVSWETSRPTDGQIFFSVATDETSPFTEGAPFFGYDHASVRLPVHTTKHYLYVPNLQSGTSYTYRIRSTNGTYTTFGGDYTFTTPGTAPPPVAQTPSTSTPSPASTPAPVAAANTSTNTYAFASSAPEPKVAPEPVSMLNPAPTVAGMATTDRTAMVSVAKPKAESQPSNGIGAMVSNVVTKVFGFF